jgi:hypothetical protein
MNLVTVDLLCDRESSCLHNPSELGLACPSYSCPSHDARHARYMAFMHRTAEECQHIHDEVALLARGEASLVPPLRLGQPGYGTRQRARQFLRYAGYRAALAALAARAFELRGAP